jgi:hypothetical protein
MKPPKLPEQNNDIDAALEYVRAHMEATGEPPPGDQLRMLIRMQEDPSELLARLAAMPELREEPTP